MYDADKVPVAPYQDVIHEARGYGITVNEMTRICNCGGQTIRRFLALDRETGMVVRGTAERIRRGLVAAMDDDGSRAYTDGQRVDPRRTQQIVHSLNAQGWSLPHLAYIIENNLDMPSTAIVNANRSKIKYVSKITEDKAEWLARQIGESRGPSRQSAAVARARGKFPLRHYNVKGELIVSSLSAEQRQILERVQSKHG